MHASHDPSDAALDRNLKSIGRTLPLPAEPAAAQRAAWKAGPRLRLRDATPSHEADAQPHTPLPRWRRIVPALGAAVAAVIVLGVLLLPSGQQNTVLAATIFRSLRETAHRGLSFEIERVKAEGTSIEGRIQFTFAQPMTIMQILDQLDSAEPDTFYTDLLIDVSPADPDVGEARVELALALAERDNWLMLRIPQPPQKLVAENPLLGMALGFLRGGIVLELGDALDQLAEQIEASIEAETGDEDMPAAMKAALAGEAAGRQVALSLSAGSQGAEAAPAVTHGPGAAAAATGFDFSAFFDGPSASGFEGVLREFLAGTLGGDRIAEMGAKIEEIAQDVQVTAVGPGEWLLTARRFKADDADDEAWLARLVLSIRYREGVGMELAELSHVGEADGVIRLRMIDQIDPALTDRQRFLNAGMPQIDVEKMLGLFGGSATVKGTVKSRSK